MSSVFSATSSDGQRLPVLLGCIHCFKHFTLDEYSPHVARPHAAAPSLVPIRSMRHSEHPHNREIASRARGPLASFQPAVPPAMMQLLHDGQAAALLAGGGRMVSHWCGFAREDLRWCGKISDGWNAAEANTNMKMRLETFLVAAGQSYLRKATGNLTAHNQEGQLCLSIGPAKNR